MEERRNLSKIIEARLSPKGGRTGPLIQVVLGPRQVGKTTAVKQVLGGRGFYHTADYPAPPTFEQLEKWWRQAQEAKDDVDKILAIDEVQKIPDWSTIVKRLWDESPRNPRVVLTGSAALLMEKGLKETLAGRFEIIHAEHWNFLEAKSVFGLDLKQFLEFGCYPGSVSFLDDIERWGSYVRDSIVEPAVGRDLLQLHPVDNPALLRQVFGAAVASPAQILSLQKIQGQLQGRGTLPTLQHYLRLLSQAFLVTGIEKYSPSPIRMRKSTPKLLVHDNALLRAFERPIGVALSASRFGQYFENAVGARFLEAGWETTYWKDRHSEVDFVVQGPGGENWAVEVKTTKTTSKDLEGLRKFCQIYPKFSPCLISLVGQSFEGIRNLDPEEILSLRR